MEEEAAERDFSERRHVVFVQSKFVQLSSSSLCSAGPCPHRKSPVFGLVWLVGHQMKVSIHHDVVKSPRRLRYEAKIRAQITKKQQKQLLAMVSSDSTSPRATSRGTSAKKHRYRRPMSAVDASKKSGLPLQIVRATLGPRKIVRNAFPAHY